MTDAACQSGPRRAARRPGPAAVVAGSLGAFFALLAFLAFQLGAGQDPALGAGETAAPAQEPRKVVVRRVRRRVIVPAGGASAAPAAGSAGAAPVAASALAPAPAPAPSAPVTRSS